MNKINEYLLCYLAAQKLDHQYLYAPSHLRWESTVKPIIDLNGFFP